MQIFGWDEMMSDGGAALQAFLRSWADSAAPGKGAQAFSALTVGDFDGCHLGHAALFRNVAAASKKSLREAGAAGSGLILVPGAVTFQRKAFSPKKKGKPAPCISTLRQRLKAMEMSGLAFALLIDFSYDFSKMSGNEFLKMLAKNARMRYLSVGEDFRCGFQLDTGQGEIARCADALGFAFEPLSQVLLGGRRVSSTDIREAVFRADFVVAEKLLGHPFVLDISALSFQPLGERCGEGILSELYAPYEAFTQVLPPAGRYSASLRGDNAADAECVCSIDNGQAVFIGREKKLSFRRGRIAAGENANAFFDELRLIAELNF